MSIARMIKMSFKASNCIFFILSLKGLVISIESKFHITHELNWENKSQRLKMEGYQILAIIFLIVFIVLIVVVVVNYDSQDKIIEMKQIEPIIAPRVQSSDVSPQKIPRIIYQTNADHVVPGGMYKAIYSWIDNNPEYEYRYYTNDECRNLIADHFDKKILKAYDMLIPGAYKADLWRYCALYKYGGVYADSAMVNLVPLSEFITADDEFVAPIDCTYSGGIYNAFMASIPKHPLLRKVIDLTVERILNKEYGDTSFCSNSPALNFLTQPIFRGVPGWLWITGPAALGDALNDMIDKPPVSPFKEKTYICEGKKVRLIKHDSGLIGIGYVRCNNKKVIRTKYPSSSQERNTWDSTGHYYTLWNERRVYNE